mgnify:CR=1 FL=1
MCLDQDLLADVQLGKSRVAEQLLHRLLAAAHHLHNVLSVIQDDLRRKDVGRCSSSHSTGSICSRSPAAFSSRGVCIVGTQLCLQLFLNSLLDNIHMNSFPRNVSTSYMNWPYAKMLRFSDSHTCSIGITVCNVSLPFHRRAGLCVSACRFPF